MSSSPPRQATSHSDPRGLSGEEQDRTYRPLSTPPPARVIPVREHITILDQGHSGAVGGFGLAAVVNYLRSERCTRDLVSPRMRDEMARRYDGFEGEGDRGSRARAALVGWQRHGVCPERYWPYNPDEPGTLSPEAERVALLNRPRSYERVEPRVTDLQAAVYETHAIFVSATIHDGWMQPRNGVIPFIPDSNAVGGHAFAILGYTQDGFIVQNSWGNEWGGLSFDGREYPGLAIWTYPDVERHMVDAWVVRLQTQRLRLAGYTSDGVVGTDRLDIMADVRAICAVLAASDVEPPLSVGLFGDWGTGKSFFMARMQDEIDKLAGRGREEPDTFCSEIVQIQFNAWHYLDANLWASLVAEIFARLFERISGGAVTDEAQRKQLEEKLGEARGLYRESRLELENAVKEHERAEHILQERIDERKQRQDTLEELQDQLVEVLKDDEQVRRQLEQLARVFGMPELATSYQALEEQTRQLQSWSKRLEQAVRTILRPEGRRTRLMLLLVIVLIPALIGYAVAYLSQTETARGIGESAAALSGSVLGLSV